MNDLIAAREKLNELKAKRRGIELLEDEALAEIQYCNERRPVLDELIAAQERHVEDLRGVSQMVASDLLWTMRKAAI